MNPEIKQQLYGGDISDYYPQRELEKKSKSPEQDSRSLSDIYSNMVAKKNILPGIKPELMKHITITK